LSVLKSTFTASTSFPFGNRTFTFLTPSIDIHSLYLRHGA
jgi:hypothetical protein